MYFWVYTEKDWFEGLSVSVPCKSAAWFTRACSMLGYCFHFYSKNTGMSYIMLSELPGESEVGTLWGKCLWTEELRLQKKTPMSTQREGNRAPAWLKHLHQQIWSAATVRPGHNSEGAYFNQRRASFPTSFQALKGYCCAWKETHHKIGFAGAKAPWDRLIRYPHQWKCLFSWIGRYRVLLAGQRTGTDAVYPLQRSSVRIQLLEGLCLPAGLKINKQIL